MSEIVRRRVRVHGEVQGVFFRDSTLEQAESEGVDGWVRNCDDATVEVVLEGQEQAVERVVAFCRRGTDQARVDSVDVTEEEPEGLQGFSVR
ncbi:MAG: acylphosphatase [Actinomycetota bacterium]|nr:acylphosphatase [Actinomycetota bacterium]